LIVCPLTMHFIILESSYIFLTVWETEGAKTFFLHLLEATFVFHPFITNLVEVFPIKWGGRFFNCVIIIDSFSLFIWLVGGRGRVGSGGGEVGSNIHQICHFWMNHRSKWNHRNSRGFLIHASSRLSRLPRSNHHLNNNTSRIRSWFDQCHPWKRFFFLRYLFYFIYFCFYCFFLCIYRYHLHLVLKYICFLTPHG